MTVDKYINWRTNKTKVVRLRQLSGSFTLTPALENAGYRVPRELLVREGFIQRAKRQVIEDENAERAAAALRKAARQLREASEGLVAAAQEASDEAL